MIRVNGFFPLCEANVHEAFVRYTLFIPPFCPYFCCTLSCCLLLFFWVAAKFQACLRLNVHCSHDVVNLYGCIRDWLT